MAQTFDYSQLSQHTDTDAYTSQIRRNLGVFHRNLDKGNWSAIESELAPDYRWNYDGTIIFGPAGGRAALTHVAGTLLGGVRAQDIYNIVDGSRGAVLFRIWGRQGADFFGVPLHQPSGDDNKGRYDVRSAERFVFDSEGRARSVTTITPIGIMKDQMRGDQPVTTTDTAAKSSEDVQLRHSPQASAEFQTRARKVMAALHLNIIAGRPADNAALAAEHVENDENGAVTRGRDAFCRVLAAESLGRGAFPAKAFHDVDVLADGRFGAVEYAWSGVQVGEYSVVATREGAQVQGRGTLFFEFGEDGLVEKVVSVFDEGAVETSLSAAG